MEKTDTLILEGGALRGVFTAGVLDVFMEKGLRLPQVVGVSAGALNGVNYVSGQAGRSRRINLGYVNDKRYMGAGNLLRDYSYFNFNFLFGPISRELDPLDEAAFYGSDQKFWAEATDCRTGKPLFFEKGALGRGFEQALIASASLPLMGKMVRVGRQVCLDGGVACGVPLPADLPFACGRAVLVLTRQKGYRKGPQAGVVRRLYRRRYAAHPALLAACLTQPERYNRQMGEIDRLEAAGEIFVIRPAEPVTVRRTEKDTAKLDALYRQGRRAAEAALPALEAFLER